MFIETTQYVFNGEFSAFNLAADQDGDIIISEINGGDEALVLTPSEAAALADRLYALAAGFEDETFDEVEIIYPELPEALEPQYGYTAEGEPIFINAVEHVETPEEVLERIVRQAIRKG